VEVCVIMLLVLSLLTRVVDIVLMLVLLLLLLLNSPRLEHGMFSHCCLPQPMMVGLYGRNVPSRVRPRCSNLMHLHRPCLSLQI